MLIAVFGLVMVLLALKAALAFGLSPLLFDFLETGDGYVTACFVFIIWADSLWKIISFVSRGKM